MYFISLALFLFVLPVASVLIEGLVLGSPATLMTLIGKWFVFWAAGVRLFLAGVMQTVNPQFTAEGIFGIKDPASHGIVREVGFGNLSFGTLGLAGLGHLMRGEGNLKERAALWTDLWAFAVLAAFVVSRFV